MIQRLSPRWDVSDRCWATWQQMSICKTSVLCTFFWNCLAAKKRPDLHKWRYNPSNYEHMTCQYKVLFENVLAVHQGRCSVYHMWDEFEGHGMVACCARVDWTSIWWEWYAASMCYGTEEGSEGVHPKSGAVPVAMIVLSCQACCTGTYGKIFPHSTSRHPVLLQKVPVTRQIPVLWTGSIINSLGIARKP